MQIQELKEIITSGPIGAPSDLEMGRTMKVLVAS